MIQETQESCSQLLPEHWQARVGYFLQQRAAARAGEMPAPAPLLVVPDVLAGLTALARAARSRSPIIACSRPGSRSPWPR